MRSNATRRTVVSTLATLAVGVLAAPASARNDDGPGGSEARPNRPRNAAALSRTATESVAVVDRIVDGRFVVLLLEAAGEVVDQLVVGREELPDVEEGDVLLVTLADGELEEARLLVGETERRRRRAERRIDCLSES